MKGHENIGDPIFHDKTMSMGGRVRLSPKFKSRNSSKNLQISMGFSGVVYSFLNLPGHFWSSGGGNRWRPVDETAMVLLIQPYQGPAIISSKGAFGVVETLKFPG